MPAGIMLPGHGDPKTQENPCVTENIFFVKYYSPLCATLFPAREGKRNAMSRLRLWKYMSLSQREGCPGGGRKSLRERFELTQIIMQKRKIPV
jgi:hypothetical protein